MHHYGGYGYGGFVGYDFSYLWYVLPGMLLSLICSAMVKWTFTRYSRVATSRQQSGAEVAAELLARSGIRNVTVERANGFLSDHYDPSARALRLSPDVYDGRSVSAVGVAAHEAGHAIQHAQRYSLMFVRQKLVLPARFGSQLSYFVILAGIMLHVTGLAWVGVILFGAVFAFELITVPVEINASARARRHLVQLGIVTPQESWGVGKVLTAAAFTYIAAMVTTLLQLMYWITQLRRR